MGRVARRGSALSPESRRAISGRTSVLPPTDSGQRRRDDVPDALVGLGRQKPGFSYRTNEAVGHRVGKAAKLQAGTRGELKITAPESLSDPAQLAKRGPGCLPAGHPDAHHCPIGRRVGPQHAGAAIRVRHARHRK